MAQQANYTISERNVETTLSRSSHSELEPKSGYSEDPACNEGRIPLKLSSTVDW
jgi:hypothetical protein